jgi:putative glutamine amidotransferase
MTRPRILLSTSSFYRPSGLRRIDALTGLNYSEAVVQFGGLPVMLPNLSPELAEAYLAEADGLLLTGGVDVDPAYFGEEPHPLLGLVDLPRDRFEIALYQAARAHGIPVLGICRGHQIINVAAGGTLHQHLPAVANTVQHEQIDISGTPSHGVALEPASVLAKAFGAEKIRTNSYHHQAVDKPGKGFKITGRSADGLAEAIESTEGTFVLGVQWHPEMSFQAFPEQGAPFHAFMKAVEEARLVAA